MGCSASCSRLVGLAEIRTTRCSASNSSLWGTFGLRKSGEPTPPLPVTLPRRPRAGGAFWVWGLSLGGGVITRGGTCRGDTGVGTEPRPRCGERGTHSKVILFSSRTSWSASTMQS